MVVCYGELAMCFALEVADLYFDELVWALCAGGGVS